MKGSQEAQAGEGIPPSKEDSINDIRNAQFVKVLNYITKVLGKYLLVRKQNSI